MKTNKKISSIIIKYKVYIYTIIILSFVFILSQMITGSYPFGNKSTIMDDGLSQGYTGYVEHAKFIKNSSPWRWISNTTGLSRDIYISSFLANIIHPFDLIKFKILPERMYLFDFTLLYYLSYILNGISIIFYLTKRHTNPFTLDDKRLVILGTIYALSSYAIIMFNYECFRLLFYTPLIIWGLEKLIYDKKKIYYIIFLSFMMIYDAYPAFIICEFLCLIFLTYSFDNIKHFFKSAISFALSSIAAAGISAFKLLPYFSMTRESGYSTNDSELPTIVGFFSSFIKLICDYKPIRYMRAISSDNSDAAIYIGMMLVVFIPLYAINKEICIAEKIKKLTLLFIIYLSFNSIVLNYIFHGFHYQSLVPNRFAAIFIFVSICMISDVLIKYNTYSFNTIIIILSICTILYSLLHMYYGDIKDKGTIIGIIILASTIILLIYNKYINKKSNLTLKSINYIMLIDIIINGIFLFPYNIGSSSNILSEAEDLNNLTSYYSDITHPLEGSVLLNSNNYNISYMTDIESPVFFYSGASSYLLNMYTKYGIHHSLNTAYYGTGNPLADMMMHTKYHIQNENNTNMTWYPKVKTVNNLSIYENPYFLPLGFMINNTYESNLKSWDSNVKDYNNLFEYNNDFFNSLIGSNIYEEINLNEYNNPINTQNITNVISSYSWKEIIEQTNNSIINYNTDTDNSQQYSSIDNDYSFFIIGDIVEKSNEQRTSYAVPVDIHICTENLDYGSYYLSTANYILYIGDITDNENINISIDIPVTYQSDLERIKNSLSIARLNKENLAKAYDVLNKNTLTNIKTNGRNITADLNTTEGGKLYISLPYSDNWKLMVDNKDIKLSTYLGGMGASISKGKHSIDLYYTPAGMKDGLIVTFATLVILLLIYIKNQIKKEDNKTVENEQ